MRIPAVFFMSALLIGCAHVEKPVAVDQTVPDRWSNGVGSSGTQSDGAAWEAFLRHTGISNLIEEAYAANPDLAAAQATVLQARAKATIARSTLFPWISVGNKSSRDILADKSAVPGVPKRKDGQLLSIGSTWDIDIWGKTAAEGRASDHDIAAAADTLEDVQRLLAMEVIRNIMLIAAIRDQREIGRKAIALSDEFSRMVNARANLGTGSALDISRQKAEVANLRAAVVSLDLAEAEASAALAALVGRIPGDVKPPLSSLAALKLPQINPTTPLDVINRRPDVRAALQLALAAGNRTQSAEAARLPSISLAAALTSVTNGSFNGIWDKEAFAQSLTSQVTAPLFQGFRLKAAHEAAAEAQKAAEANYRSRLLNALKEAEMALASVKVSSRRVGYLSLAAREANHAVELSQKLYQDGVIGYADLLDLQRTSFSTDYDLVSERYQQFESAIALAASIGGPPPIR